MPTRRHALCALASLPWAVHRHATAAGVRVEGQWFDAVARVAGSELQLNGTGVRAVAWFKAFVAGLYLPQPARSTAQAVGQAGPKRLQLRMLRELPAAEFSKAIQKGVTRNVTAAELSALQDRLHTFEATVTAMGKVRLGDVIDLDQVPGQGMGMRLNGTLRGGAIAGDEFFAAVLLSFLGEQPYDNKLKAGLLGVAA